MGGPNEAERLKAAGVRTRKGSVTKVPLTSFVVITEGPTSHPRWKLPIEPSLRAHIFAKGIPGRFTAREAPQKKGPLLFEVVDGARRLKTGLDVQDELRSTRPRQPPLVWDRDDPSDPGSLYVDLDLWDGTDAELLLARLEANRGGLPDSLSVLAAIVKGLASLGCEDMKAICAVMPRHITPKVVQALGRWGNLAAELRPRFDTGEFPPDLLPAVLDAPRDEQVATAERLKANGIRTTRGATRHTNGQRDKADPWARRMSPRQAVRVAETLSGAVMVNLTTAHAKSIAQGVIAGLRLGANEDPKTVLRDLPTPIADAIREARAGQAGAK